MLEFYKSRAGRAYFESTLPSLIRVLERIADVLEREQERESKKEDVMKPGIRSVVVE